MKFFSICMLFCTIAIILLIIGPKENQCKDKAFMALKRAAGIALLFQRKRFRIIPLPIPLPLPLPIPIELKEKHHHNSWPTISHSWAPPNYEVINSLGNSYDGSANLYNYDNTHNSYGGGYSGYSGYSGAHNSYGNYVGYSA